MPTQRSRSFGSVAELYDRYRPSPPAQLADELGPIEGRDVLEIAAGTGLVTRFLLGLGARVSVVEPDDQMRAVLERRSPQVTSISATAEALPFEDATFDEVVVSSAWHWFTQPDASDEIARVLRDAGRLVVLTNTFNEGHEWFAKLAQLRRQSADLSGPAHRERVATSLLNGAFGDERHFSVEWTWRRTNEEVVQLFHTYSGVITRPENERRALEQVVRAEVSAMAPSGSINVPMVLRGVVAGRLER
jgi:SAM-dependent methyltransferase